MHRVKRRYSDLFQMITELLADKVFLVLLPECMQMQWQAPDTCLDSCKLGLIFSNLIYVSLDGCKLFLISKNNVPFLGIRMPGCRWKSIKLSNSLDHLYCLWLQNI